jgi:hypothetical protein
VRRRRSVRGGCLRRADPGDLRQRRGRPRRGMRRRRQHRRPRHLRSRLPPGAPLRGRHRAAHVRSVRWRGRAEPPGRLLQPVLRHLHHHRVRTGWRLSPAGARAGPRADRPWANVFDRWRQVPRIPEPSVAVHNPLRATTVRRERGHALAHTDWSYFTHHTLADVDNDESEGIDLRVDVLAWLPRPRSCYSHPASAVAPPFMPRGSPNHSRQRAASASLRGLGRALTST